MAKKGGTRSRPRPGVAPAVPGSRKRQAAGRATAAVRRPGLALQGSLAWTVIITWALTVLFFWTGAADPVNLPKLTVLIGGALVITALWAARVAGGGLLVLPVGAPAYALAAFVVCAVITTLTAPDHWIALIGDYRRNIGLALYLCCAVLFLASRVMRMAQIRRLLYVGVAVAGLLGFYGVLQSAGVDPVGWSKLYNPVIATLGNPDFASAFFGISVPLAMWAVLRPGSPMWARLGSALGGLLAAAAAVRSGALQGWIAGAIGAAFFLLCMTLAAEGRVRAMALRAWTACAVVAAVLLGTGLGGWGPLSRLGERHSLGVRRYYWDAALSMFTHHPVTGVGMSMYGHAFRQYRSPDAVRALTPGGYSNAAHDVPLAMLSTGGIILALSYLAFVGAVGWILLSLVRRRRGEDLLLVGAVGGAWLAYQAQSLVSIDMVSLATTHFLLAGVILAVDNRARLRTFHLGWSRGAARESGAAGWAAAGSLVVAAVVFFAVAIGPIRADVLYRSASANARSGDGASAVRDLSRAISLAGWQNEYRFSLAQMEVAARQDNQVLSVLADAVAADPRDADALVNYAKVQAALGDKAGAFSTYERELRLDPYNTDVIASAVRLGEGLRPRPSAALLRMYRAGLAVSPTDVDSWLGVARQEQALGRRDQAISAYRRALQLAPSSTAARTALDELAGASASEKGN